MEIHWKILDEKRKALLPLFKSFVEEGFYLAGGTGLALQLGHRDSIDFDFFKEGDFDTTELLKKIESLFASHKISITQEEKNTVSLIIDESIRASFFGVNQKIIKPFVETEYFPIASIQDAACMKLSAIVGRSLEKDYVDIYFILQKLSLRELLELCVQKYPNLDAALILKSLVYFGDIHEEPILFKENHDVSFETVKRSLEKVVVDYFKSDT